MTIHDNVQDKQAGGCKLNCRV